MKPLRLRTSLTLAYVAVLALVLTVMGVAVHFAMVRQIDSDTTDRLNEKARALHGYLKFTHGQPSLVYEATDADEAAFIDDATDYYQIYDTHNGKLLVQSPALEAAGLHYTPAEVSQLASRTQPYDVQTDNGRIRIANSVISPAPGETYLVQVGDMVSSADAALVGFDRILWLRILAGIAVAAVVGPWFAGRALAPLAAFAAKTRAIGVSNLHERVATRHLDDELDQLADAFNATLERLEQSVGDMRQFSAALAHELRTPIAILRGEAEFELTHPLAPGDRRERLISQIEEYDRLTGLISQILTLARAEAGEITLALKPVALDAVASNVAEQIEPVASARNISLTCDVTDDATVSGDRDWLERLLLILLDNAIKFTPDAGRVAIRVARAGKLVRLTVADSGVGIAADQIPHLFQRFFRADSSASTRVPGFGLGLALAKWIAEQHGATIEVASTAGAGTTFAVAFRALIHLPAGSPQDASPTNS